MTLVMPYVKLSQIVGSSQLINASEVSVFMKAINHACLFLGIIVFFAIIPSLLGSLRDNAKDEISNS